MFVTVPQTITRCESKHTIIVPATERPVKHETKHVPQDIHLEIGQIMKVDLLNIQIYFSKYFFFLIIVTLSVDLISAYSYPKCWAVLL